MGIPGFKKKISTLPAGPRDLITDVDGVTVGHCTLHGGNIHTGVTALFSHQGDIFHDKCVSAVHVINGFGKSCGLVQSAELGTVETPLIFTNTLSVGTAWDALAGYMLSLNPDIGVATGTVNPIVFECNDGYLNDIRGRHINESHVLSALGAASSYFAEGSVGAGAGMSCYSMKGGIGSASRIFELYGKSYTLGTLLLTNFGSMRDLLIYGDPVGRKIYEKLQHSCAERDRGSVITVIATDVPLTSRQLERAAKRVQSGLARTGSISGNGSGEIVLAFTTANRIPHYDPDIPITIEGIHDDDMDIVFRAVIECVEESVISSLVHAESVTGFMGHTRTSLSELLTEEL